VTQLDVMPEAAAPLSVRAVDKVANLLAGRESTRRRFLARLAVIGSALALDPLRFLLRPTPAYASVCGSGNTCGSGWTVFCCTINDGANTCPDGSFVAGWWKVDASSFCLGAPRYYIDCNRRPNASCSCHCNHSGCDRRRVCCNVFRYGQCNTQIGGVTAVVCRIITCTPPWQWDPSCGRTVRTSPSTASHSSRCLPGTNPTRIEIKYQDLGLVGSALGRPVNRERDAAGGGRKRGYENGMILYHRDTGAHEVRTAIARRYRRLEAEAGPLGYPRTDHRRVGDGDGAYSRFAGGSIYRSGEHGARAVLRRADRAYRRMGGPRGRLGYPTAGTGPANGAGRVTRFEKGAIYMSPRTPAIAVRGAILALFENRGGPAGTNLGFPTDTAVRLDDGGRLQRFEDGIIAGPSADNLFIVRGDIADRHREEGGVAGPWGYPTADTQAVEGTEGLVSPFTTRTAFWSAATGAHWLSGAILERYLAEGGPAGPLGFPLTDVVFAPDGTQSATFERGTITHDPSTGHTEVVGEDGGGNGGGNGRPDRP
jgi:hypothetical protein